MTYYIAIPLIAGTAYGPPSVIPFVGPYRLLRDARKRCGHQELLLTCREATSMNIPGPWPDMVRRARTADTVSLRDIEEAIDELPQAPNAEDASQYIYDLRRLRNLRDRLRSLLSPNLQGHTP